MSIALRLMVISVAALLGACASAPPPPKAPRIVQRPVVTAPPQI
ncbi:peptidase P60, partial [Pseudomonas syringae]|nr:peptidase P60 [Pseudomonas syringae]